MRVRKFVCVYVLCLVLWLPGRGAEAVGITIDIPSLTETVLESGRDFYVSGRILRDGLSPSEFPIDVRVEVADAGLMRDGVRRPLRVVQSRVDVSTGLTPRRDIYLRYDGKAPWVALTPEEVMASPPPDLVYRHGDPASFYDPRVKVSVSEDRYAALVQGGVTGSYDSDYVKLYKKDLEWRYYRVSVYALHGGEVVAERYIDVMFGSSPDKLLARFSPAAHKKRVEEFASERGYRIYNDPFPGYWRSGLPEPYEIPLRWRANDALEYTTGRVHAVLYNIPEKRSAAQEVELGRMAYEGRMFRDDEVVFYCYDAGEPELAYLEWDGRRIRRGELTRLEDGERLRFTRAEVGERPEKYFPDGCAGRVDWNVYDSVAAPPGVPVTFYGVAPPIQPMLSEVDDNEDGTFTIRNRIASIRYRFDEKSSGEVFEMEFPMGLDRFYGEGSAASPSIYEFRHTVKLPGSGRKRLYTVTAEGFDMHGEKVSGSEAMFYLWIR